MKSSRHNQGYSTIALGGMVWVAFTAVATKSASFGSQFALGWLLSENDFAVYALAISLASMVSVLKDGGTKKLLIQRGTEYNELARPILTLSIIFNSVAAILLVLGAKPLAELYNAPALPPLIWIIAISLVIACPSMVLRAKLTIDLDFARIAKVSTISVYLRHGLMVLFALLGFGPMSFVLPLPIVALFELITYFILVKKREDFAPKNKKLTKDLFHELFSSSRWIMAGTLASALVNQGDYLIIGKLSPEILGVYFFGFQLSVAFTTIFTTGMRSVLMPTMARIAADSKRLAGALRKSVLMVGWVVVPLSFVVIITVPLLVDLLWAGKWNESIVVAQIMLLSLVFRLLTPVAQATMEARGKWRAQSLLLLLDGAGTILAAVIGSLFGGLLAVTIAVAINRAIMALIQCAWAGHEVSSSVRGILWAAVGPAIVATLAALAAYLITITLFGGIQPTPIITFICLVIYLVVFCSMAYYFKPKTYEDLLNIIKSRLSN